MQQTLNYICPVCGYPYMEGPPENYSICACCGTEFGNDDFNKSHAELRNRWIKAGTHWFDNETAKPINWDPFKQIEIFNLQRLPMRAAKAIDNAIAGTEEIKVYFQHLTAA